MKEKFFRRDFVDKILAFLMQSRQNLYKAKSGREKTESKRNAICHPRLRRTRFARKKGPSEGCVCCERQPPTHSHPAKSAFHRMK
mgnify:CR=1 FL=1